MVQTYGQNCSIRFGIELRLGKNVDWIKIPEQDRVEIERERHS